MAARKHPKDLIKDTLVAFHALVPTATQKKEAVFELNVGGTPGQVRVMRADKIVNQVHVCRGEPLVIHIPSPAGDAWYVVPVAWQLAYAGKNPKKAAQHASHAFDCMFFKPDELSPKHLASADKLTAACEDAIIKARDPVVRIMVKATARARDAVTTALLETLREEVDLVQL